MESVQENYEPEVKSPQRRSFIAALFALSTAAVSVLLAAPLVRFVTYPMRKGATSTGWSDIGQVGDFNSLTTPVAKTITLERRDAWQSTTTQTAVYVLPPKNGVFKVLSPVCPHLGCAVRWIDTENKFICPCHSGAFTATGERISGPPPRNMDSLEAKVEDGVLKVRYQYFRQLVTDKQVMA